MPGQQANSNNQYPDIDDAGDVEYLTYRGQGNAVVLNRGGTESIIQFTTINLLSGQERKCGQHFGIAGNGTTITYFDFLTFGFGPRNFVISSVGQLAPDFTGDDYPDINSQGTFVFSSSGSVYLAPVSAPNNLTPIASGDRPRIADVVAPATTPEIVYISGGAQVVSTIGGVIDAGSWADVNNAGTVVYEGAVGGFNQIFIAKTGSGGTINVTTNFAAATFTVAGPATYGGSGLSFTQSNAPAGLYTIAFGAIAGYTTPPSQTQTLTDGGTISFTGTYQGPMLVVSPQNLSFTYTEDATVPLPPKLVTVSSSNTPLSFTVTPPTSSWLSVTPGSGTTLGVLSVSVNLGLATGTYSDQFAVGSSNASDSPQTVTVVLTVTPRTVSKIQLVCRPMRSSPADICGIQSRVFRHCYFLRTDVDGTGSTYGGYPYRSIPRFWGRRTPKKNADNFSPPGGCSPVDRDFSVSVCSDTSPAAGTTLEDLAQNLETAVNAGPDLAYNPVTNNSNLWVLQQIVQDGVLGVSLPASAPTNAAESCTQVPAMKARLAACGASPSLAQHIINSFESVSGVSCP